MTAPGVEARDLTVRFGDTTAVDGVDLTFAPGRITGLLGRNGAGKTTLLAALAGHRRPTVGQALVDGEPIYEHPRLVREVCLVRQHGDFEKGMTGDEVLELAGELRPRWDEGLARTAVERFRLDTSAKVGALSTGSRAALAATVGLAARAPVTLLDEPHLGMDAPSRYELYDLLLADYAEAPRTIVLSTHLIDEAARLFEDVVVIDRGRVLVHDEADRLGAQGAELIGPAEAIRRLTEGLDVLGERALGPTTATVVRHLDDDGRAAARRAGVEVAPLPLQDLFVHLVRQEADR